ncbi:MAG: excinuclease ABC subunit UvrC [Candidatus Omnitrophica bacterium]|nr:excinuclease ABC subunit UvrC [Candidatus Omnitrophota bacterium]
MGIQEKIKQFPDTPGVYLMKDETGRILYVGKASSLKKRLSSYFQKPPNDKTAKLLLHTEDIDYIQSSSSAQALLLENSLIKKYQPYYNAALKDDKSYPFVKINMQDSYPQVTIVRGRKDQTAHYYGPYTNVKLIKAALKAIRAIFPFRSCRRLPKRPCLYLHLKLCPGMCAQTVDKKAYRQNLRQLELFLEGRYKQLIGQLTGLMQRSAEQKLFEQAAALRDRINSLTEIVSQTKETKRSDIILELQKTLALPWLPERIEAFDISEISGSAQAGSMVSFVHGRPDKNYYRHFQIKTVSGVDDYAMMREVLKRRYTQEPKEKSLPRPDLVMIDGGKGHLSSAQKELKTLGLSELPVIALAKRLETIYTRSGTLNLPRDSRVLHLLQRIRDEAHRFAISYHRKLRQRKMRVSSLDQIPGIGPKRKQLLLRYFKSLQAIREASIEELLKINGIDKSTAKNIIKHLR